VSLLEEMLKKQRHFTENILTLTEGAETREVRVPVWDWKLQLKEKLRLIDAIEYIIPRVNLHEHNEIMKIMRGEK